VESVSHAADFKERKKGTAKNLFEKLGYYAA
jgi:hypothetical protein